MFQLQLITTTIIVEEHLNSPHQDLGGARMTQARQRCNNGMEDHGKWFLAIDYVRCVWSLLNHKGPCGYIELTSYAGFGLLMQVVSYVYYLKVCGMYAVMKSVPTDSCKPVFHVLYFFQACHYS